MTDILDKSVVRKRPPDLSTATVTTLLLVRSKTVSARQLVIREFRDDLSMHFHDINEEWISSMFHLEDTDREVLE
jgi:hypothetical protein